MVKIEYRKVCEKDVLPEEEAEAEAERRNEKHAPTGSKIAWEKPPR